MNRLINILSLASENEVRITAGAYKVLDMLERKNGVDILNYIYPSIEANITHKRDINKIVIGDLLISYYRETGKIIGFSNPGYFNHYLDSAKPNLYNKQSLINRDVERCYDETKGADLGDIGFAPAQQTVEHLVYCFHHSESIIFQWACACIFNKYGDFGYNDGC